MRSLCRKAPRHKSGEAAGADSEKAERFSTIDVAFSGLAVDVEANVHALTPRYCA
jgi:hypothetical protein